MHKLPGLVIGRFQPPHLEHERYYLTALQKCDFLWIGIVTPEVGVNQNICDSGKHRLTQLSNPFSYHHRLLMIKGLLESKGIPRSRFEFIPFPMDNLNLVHSYTSPQDVQCFVSILDEWSLQKAARLAAAGFKVESLWTDYDERTSGSDIRKLIMENKTEWQKYVPKFVENYILTHQLDKILLQK